MEPEFGLTTPVPPGHLTRAGYCATHPFRELVLSFLVSGRPGRSGSSDRFIGPGCLSDPDRSAVPLARLSRSLPVTWLVYKHSFCYSPNFSFLSTQNAMDSHCCRRLRRGRRPHTPSVASALSSSARPQRPQASVSVPPARLRRRPRPRHQCPRRVGSCSSPGGPICRSCFSGVDPNDCSGPLASRLADRRHRHVRPELS